MALVYSFLDIAVLAEVRERFSAGDALAVLSPDLSEILWANGSGASWLGYSDIEAAIGAAPRLPAVALRQVKAAPGFPEIGRDSPIALRLAGGMQSRIVTLQASTISLPRGERALLLALPLSAAGTADERKRAEQAVAGFDEPGHFAAFLDGDGTVIAASAGFDSLRIAPESLTALVEEVRSEDDRLVKKRITGARQFPAGIARLTDSPATHLLIVVDEAPAAPAAGGEIGPAKSVMEEASPEQDVPAAELPTGTREEKTPATTAAEDPDETPEQTPPVAVATAGPEEVAAETHPIPESSGESPLPSTVRFAWRTDAQGRFSSISDAFVEAMGAPAVDVIGRSFKEVSQAFGLDPDGSIGRLLERRDTWSGRTVLWPLSGTDLKVPVDLAALPVYGRERNFEGFRGFGIARLTEAQKDEEAVGLTLVRGEPQAAPAGAEESVAPQSDKPADAQEPAGLKAEELVEAAEHEAREEAGPAETRDIGGDEQEPVSESGGIRTAGGQEKTAGKHDPFLGETPQEITPAADKIIRLVEHRGEMRDGGLSNAERTAFREIGERLRRASDAMTARAATDEHAAAENASKSFEVEDTATTEPSELDQATPEPGPAQPEMAEPETAEPEAMEPERPETEAPGAETEEPATATPEAPEVPEAALPQPPLETVEERRSEELPSAFFSQRVPGQGRAADTALLAKLPLPILVHAGDDLYFANQEFFAVTGYADLAALEAAGGIGALFEEPQEAAEGETRRQMRLRTADGTEVPVEAHLQSVPWEGGKALMLALRTVSTGTAKDEEGAESAALAEPAGALETRLAEMRAIVDTATDGIAVIANDGTIRSVNRPAEALFGFDAEHITGKPFTALFAIESQRTVEDYLTALADNGVASVLNDGRQVIGREAQGRFIPLFMTIGRLPKENGYCAVLRDITNWKRAEEELTQARAEAERASSQKSEFLARVSHEIRTPLNAIIGFSELMMDEKFGPIGNERYRDYLRDINRSGNHVLDLVNDLLDISKIEAGQQEMHYEAVSLNETLGETVAMMQPQANGDRVIIRSSFSSHLPDVVADLRSVRQIALNLLSNAVRYTPAGGQVIVSTAYDRDGSVTLRVRDTGVGMSTAELDEALRPFKQINTLRRKRGDGTGLGLPLTRAMVEANRAQFAIHSTPGEGTLVEVTFPPTRVLAD